MTKLSAVVLVKDEEACLDHCLEQLSWCDEVLVIDDGSFDSSVTIAKKTGARVISRAMEGDWGQQRNFGLDKATYEWVLFVDADEIVSKELAEEIYKSISQKSVDAYSLRRTDRFIGKELRFGETGAWRGIRLAKKSYGRWKGTVHEVWVGEGVVGTLETPLLHEPHANVTDFIDSINRYTSVRAKELFDSKVNVHWWDILLYPKAKFVQNYFVKQGFRDGSHGLVHASLMSLHSFLVRGKLYLLNRNGS